MERRLLNLHVGELALVSAFTCVVLIALREAAIGSPLDAWKFQEEIS
jgi:hypothetical protein